ncbi:MAG: PorV/PorQ family protein [Ignavibacteriales bacterium]|nr:PorV/PorQ family protein [Ignavibacteriales bacterium]
MRHTQQFIIGLTALFAAAALHAQEFKKTATAGFTFLEVPATARAAALGEASLALADENAAAVFNNPASLGFTGQVHSFSASYAPWLAEIKNYASSYAIKTDAGVIGVGLVLFDYGTMPRTVVAQNQQVYDVIGTFNANSMAFGVTYSRMLTDHFSFGTTVKYVQEKIDIYTASNIVLDAGVLYYTGLGSMRIAAAVQNFGVNAKFINDEFKMPAVFKLGVAGEVLGDASSEHRVTLTAEARHPNDGDEKVSVGAEYSWQNILALRGGYKFFYDEETYSVGIGLNPQLPMPVTIDIAYSDYGRLDKILRMTLQVGLN